MSRVSDHRCINATTAWQALLYDLRTEGAMVVSRGYRCFEMLDSRVVFDMNYPLLNFAERKLFFRFAFAEAEWIIDGRDDTASICDVNPKLMQFSDDGERFYGAYGPRFRAQRTRVADALAADQGSRQAVIHFWHEQNPQKTKDMPCSVSAQWMIRLGKLHCFYSMRSNDLWLGWPYDVFSFSCMSAYIALMLRERGVFVDIGDMYHRAASLHLYEEQSFMMHKAGERVAVFPDAWGVPSMTESLHKFSNPDDFLFHLQKMRNKNTSDGRWLAPVMEGVWAKK